MHHQGIFRIPGAQADINAYKLQFERGLYLLLSLLLPFTRCRYCHTPPLWHAACTSMSTTTMTTRDRGDRYGPIKWANDSITCVVGVVTLLLVSFCCTRVPN